MLLEAFDEVRGADEDLELWIAGQPGFGGEDILGRIRAREGSGVRYLGPQPARALQRLMHGAFALCAPSLAEGFGLPPLEAMVHGTPVLASDIPAHREVLGEAAMLLPATASDEWGSAMRRLAEDPELAARLGRLGVARAAGLSWARSARDTEVLYGEVLGRAWPRR